MPKESHVLSYQPKVYVNEKLSQVVMSREWNRVVYSMLLDYAVK